MACVLLRTPTHFSPAVATRFWISRKCLHATLPATSSSSSPSPKNTSNKASSIKGPGQTVGQTRTVNKRVKRPEYKSTENLVKKHLVELRDNPLTFKDVENLKPRQQADAKLQHYESEYKHVLNSLMKSFTWPQLRQYIEHANSFPPAKMNKLATAQYILEEMWGWTPLKQVLQDRVDWTESSEQHFSLDPCSSFLLVGKDGTELLKLSRRYNVQMSFTNPRSLKVTGLKGALKQLSGYIDNFKNDVTVEEILLPAETDLSALADRISRISGAYVKPKDNTKMSISFLKSLPQAGDVAKRLILQAVIHENPPTRVIYKENSETLDVSSPQPYSLYPFSPPQPLPWQKSSPSSFRYRRVGEWLKTGQPDKLDIPFEVPADNNGMASLDTEFESNVKSVLLRQLGDNVSAPVIFTVSSGHLLFLSPPNQPTTLTPPLTGQIDQATLLHWLSHSEDRVVFQPSAPAQVLTIPAFKETHLRRLVYRTIKPSQKEKSPDSLNSSDLATTLTLEIPVVESRQTTDESATLVVDSGHASLVKGIETSMDVFVPDGSADIKITASKVQSLPISSLPEEVSNIPFLLQANGIKSRIDASFPLMFTYEGTEFYFCHDTYVHRTLKKIPVEGQSDDHSITVETSTDHETGKTTIVCKAVCEDYTSDTQWHSFLRMCESFSVPRPKKAAQRLFDAYPPFRPVDA